MQIKSGENDTTSVTYLVDLQLYFDSFFEEGSLLI